MSNLLLQTFSLDKPFDGKYVIDCECRIREFEKLSQILTEGLKDLDSLVREDVWLNEKVHIRLDFETIKHDTNIFTATGALKTRFYLTCQKCLKLLENEIEVPVKLALHNKRNEVQNMHGYEYWELTGRSVKTLDLIEELLIMAIPLYIKHNADEDCTSLDVIEFQKQQVTLPFADLKNRIKKSNN